jgi:D-3-phosphoglycerate dehydrogenase / 2-oxoglutarate reductase
MRGCWPRPRRHDGRCALPPNNGLVLVTDYAWPDLEIERGILAASGIGLAAGPGPLIPAGEVEALVRAHRPDAILTNWAVVSGDAIRSAPGLRMVGRLGVGLDNIDVAVATEVGAWVTNAPDYCVEEVSDHAVGLLLDWARGISRFSAQVGRGVWAPETARLRRVSDLTVALLGLGRIGRRTAVKLGAWGCRLVGVNRDGEVPAGVERMELDAALAVADAVIVHLPGTPATKHLLDARRIGLMKPGALLVNVGRGSVVDTAALIDALERGHLGAAALDVLETEPTPAPGLLRDDVVITPHVAFTSDASLRDLRTTCAEEAVRVLTGGVPVNACNRPALD